MHRKTIFSILALALFLVASPATAQQTNPQQQPQDLPDIEVSDQELQTIAEAYVAVQNLTVEYRDKINAAQDAETAREIQQEYARVTTNAIQDEGVTVDRYDTVIQVASADQALGERLLAEIQKIAGAQQGDADTDS